MVALADTPIQPLGSASGACTLVPAGALCTAHGEAWQAFCDSWNDLPADQFMADGGTYRHRRYAAFRSSEGALQRLPHQAHFQDLSHNRLNGGVERWFAPITDEVVQGAVFQHILAQTLRKISAAGDGLSRGWHVEAHQFRILARADRPGLPTPEGMHRDGRDWVLICLIGHHNLRGGETEVRDSEGRLVMSHRLAQAGEGLWLDDHAVLHGTSPVEPCDAQQPAWRDTLVLTFRQTNHE